MTLYNPFLDKFRGFCYLTYKENDAFKACLNCDNHFIEGRKVLVEKAFTKEESIQILKNEKDRKIYITGLPIDADELILKNHFKQFGEVLEIKINRQTDKQVMKCFAFVTFNDASSVAKSTSKNSQYIKDLDIEVSLLA